MQSQVARAFPTWIGRFRPDGAEGVNREVRAAVLAREAATPSWDRANVGGWHSTPDLLRWPLPELRTVARWFEEAVDVMIRASLDGASPSSRERRAAGMLAFQAWANVSRNGDYHAQHNHPGCCWSGVYWVDAGGPPLPGVPLGGNLDLFDPRVGAELNPTPGDPFGHPLSIPPEAGVMVVFPSFLSHFVHPFRGAGVRISIAFNARVAHRKAPTAGIPNDD